MCTQNTQLRSIDTLFENYYHNNMRVDWKNSMTCKCLIAIRDILDDVYDVLPKHKSLYEVLYKDERRKIYHAIIRLKSAGYIVEQEQGGEKIFSLTEKGKIKLISVANTDKSWDGHWRFVIFDIPFKKRDRRDFFRRKIKELGFKQYQKSVWISPHDFEEEIDTIKKFLFFNPYIKYILAKKISDEKKWGKSFGLKNFD